MKQNLVVRHIKNKNYVGFVFSEHIVPTPTETGTLENRVMIGVCWQNKRTPAISYHTPEELEWLELQPVVIEELYSDEEEEDEDDEADNMLADDTDSTQEATI